MLNSWKIVAVVAILGLMTFTAFAQLTTRFAITAIDSHMVDYIRANWQPDVAQCALDTIQQINDNKVADQWTIELIPGQPLITLTNTTGQIVTCAPPALNQIGTHGRQ